MNVKGHITDITNCPLLGSIDKGGKWNLPYFYLYMFRHIKWYLIFEVSKINWLFITSIDFTLLFYDKCTISYLFKIKPWFEIFEEHLNMNHNK